MAIRWTCSLGNYLLMLVTLLSVSTHVFASGPDYGQVTKKARAILEELIAINTTNPPGNETAAAKVVQRRLRQAGIETKVLESSPGRGNLIARLRGDGSKKPLLVLAHIDIVLAGPNWSADPFKLVEKDGYLYGCGMSDDKEMAAAAVTILLDLKHRKVPLARDVIVALTADEESGGDAGIRWILAEHRDLLDVEFTLNEGAGARLKNGKLQYIGLQAAEKVYQTFFPEVEGRGWHSSVPRPGNPLYRMARVLGRIEGHVFPPSLNETTRAYFAGLAKVSKGGQAADMRALAEVQGIIPGELVKRIAKSARLNSKLRTTCVATMIEGGQRKNSLPQKVKATVNCRALPGKEKNLTANLRKVVDDPEVKIVKGKDMGSGPASPVVGPVPQAVREVAAVMASGVPILVSMSSGATDSRHARASSIRSYGLKPFSAASEDWRRTTVAMSACG